MVLGGRTKEGRSAALKAAHALFRIAFASVSSIRACRPGPADLKWSITSADNRRDTSLFVGAFCGPRLPRRIEFILHPRSPPGSRKCRGNVPAMRRQISRREPSRIRPKPRLNRSTIVHKLRASNAVITLTPFASLPWVFRSCAQGNYGTIRRYSRIGHGTCTKRCTPRAPRDGGAPLPVLYDPTARVRRT
jgi:hypothetical protein